jgi:Protein of unknown function (DUF2585)
MGPRPGVSDGVRTRRSVTLDGVVPPLLVLLAAGALLAGRRLLWPRPGSGETAPPPWTDAAIAALVVALGAALLLAMGRPPAYQHGPVRLWSGDVQSDQNSQQLADPYTLTHVTHGILLFSLVGLVGRSLPTGTRGVVAIALECAWEVFENTDLVIQRYRATTVSLGYYGDSVLNTVGDVLAAAVGCLLAAWLPAWLLVLGVVLLEGILALWIRDNLTLNILMLLRPIEAIRRWQLGG